MTEVVFAMEWVPQYRVPFYDALRKRLSSDDVTVRLLHGDPPPSRSQRQDGLSLPWAEHVPNRVRTVRGRELTWQPIVSRIGKPKLIICQQETGLLFNYLALFRSRVGGPKLALWGHGHNFNPLEASSVTEWVKRKVTRHASWFFAYTERSAEVFRSIGCNPERITVVQNALDTSALAHPSGQASADVVDLIAGLRSRKARVGWIVSALDRWKRTSFLIEILDAVKDQIPEFEFLVLGAGDQDVVVREATARRPWLHVLGPRFGADKAALGQVAELTIHPGLAGLHVIESFATGTPMVTAALPYHSHETDYLEPGLNSVVLPAEASASMFASTIVELLGDRERLATLQAGCRHANEQYTIDTMVDRFATGIVAALNQS